MKRFGKTERAFTVIELLVVIAVIMILAGILVPVVMGARARAKIRLAKATMKTMCVALDRYYQAMGCYPPDTGMHSLTGTDACQDGAGPNDRYSLYRYLCGANGQGIVDNRTNPPQRYSPFMVFKDSQLINDGGAADERVVMDAWGTPWVYEESMSYSLMRPGVSELGTYNPTHHPTRYDIYSVGPDLQLDPGSHDMLDNDTDGYVDEPDEAYLIGGGSGNAGDEGDDITNWW